jgi:hypothetical protein
MRDTQAVALSVANISGDNYRSNLENLSDSGEIRATMPTSVHDRFGPFKEALFGDKICDWEKNIPKCGNKVTLELCAKKVANDTKLIQELKSSKDPIALILTFLSDKDIEPGTSDLRSLIKEIKKEIKQRSLIELNIPSINLPIASYIKLRAALTEPEVTKTFDRIAASSKDRGERLILLGHLLNEVGVVIKHLSQIYSALPEEIKEKVAKVNLPLKVAEEIRGLCCSPECAEILKEHENSDGATKLIELARYLVSQEVGTQNLGHIYSALPQDIKEQVAKVDLSLKVAEEIRGLCRSPECAEILKEHENSDGATKLIELAIYLVEDKKVGTQNLGHIYSALPKEIKEKVAKVDLPLKVAEEIRGLCRSPECAKILKEHKNSDGATKLIELAIYLVEDKNVGTQNLGQIYSALPKEIKEKVAQVNLPLKVAEEIRDHCRSPECATFLEKHKNSDGATKLIELARYLVSKNVGTDNLGHIYSALPQDIKEQVDYVALPLKVADEIQRFGRSPECAEILKEHENSDGATKLIELAKYLDSKNVGTDNLSHIYSALPKEIKEKVAYVNLPLKVAEEIRTLCRSPECATFLEKH